ncbi:hypothetical protein MPTK1_1g28750 [Marchantia polymorpha subsp. ruderalis]|uniref:Uncharacterized protein n=2 Tax=Marchantia polymorpha TaxID=3197 RepID=A0AAF6AVC2_MARPO|nr:hypothetical protein MARPO_0002s0005 [Marchantia polymorpha]BBN00393.1 hypothetical protein Mp_1g28750 [Marchantia polymorpha subsp. ruderalis]|eukprot:PTQ49490.1 hypothetical protein MARPO_0002s0005 [Marchantia polymorpha]
MYRGKSNVPGVEREEAPSPRGGAASPSPSASPKRTLGPLPAMKPTLAPSRDLENLSGRSFTAFPFFPTSSPPEPRPLRNPLDFHCLQLACFDLHDTKPRNPKIAETDRP